MAYMWENVYAYDKEFRYHITRHPTRSWAVILTQAWTMLIKDRIRSDLIFQKGGGLSGRREPCRRFNKGKCSFGLSCRYDHRCSVRKCGKFGHGAYQCRLRGQDERKDDYMESRERCRSGDKKKR